MESLPTQRRRRKRAPVQIVRCPSDFPTGSKDNKDNWPREGKRKLFSSDTQSHQEKKKFKGLDWNATAAEIHALGIQELSGRSKSRKRHLEQKYEALTKRQRKRQHVPLPIVRGIKKKAAERERRVQQEARETGLVLPSVPRKKRSMNRARGGNRDNSAGPAPSIGFMTNGVFRPKIEKRR